MSVENFNQCEMKKDTHIQIAWIPQKYAVLNKVIHITENGKSTGNWTVTFVGSQRERKDLPNYHQAVKQFKSVTPLSK